MEEEGWRERRNGGGMRMRSEGDYTITFSSHFG